MLRHCPLSLVPEVRLLEEHHIVALRPGTGGSPGGARAGASRTHSMSALRADASGPAVPLVLLLVVVVVAMVPARSLPAVSCWCLALLVVDPPCCVLVVGLRLLYTPDVASSSAASPGGSKRSCLLLPGSPSLPSTPSICYCCWWCFSWVSQLSSTPCGGATPDLSPVLGGVRLKCGYLGEGEVAESPPAPVLGAV